MKRLFVMAVVASLAGGCAAQRLMSVGPIKIKSDDTMGLLVEGSYGRRVECLSEKVNSFADLKEGQWVVVEGTPSHEGNLVIRLNECRVLAVVLDGGPSGPGLGECRRVPSAGLVPVAETPNK
jgi:hypothetical protein